MRSIAIITTQAFSLVNFRGPLIRTLSEQSVKVYALAPDFDEFLRAQVVEMGAEPVDYALSRVSINPILDVVAIFRLAWLLNRLSPDMTFAYSIKPVIYGSIAAWLARVPKRFSLIEGLGYVFVDDISSRTWQRSLLRWAVSRIYKLALKLNQKVFIVNKDDIAQFVDEGIVADNKVVWIDGIGLDLDHFRPAPSVVGPVTFILIARMLREKGVYDFVEAARQVRKRYPTARFLLVGAGDKNPGSIQETELRAWAAEGLVEWPGQVKDVRQWFVKSSVFVLPSYREGLPRSTQEAMAMGLPVITTDQVGCRDTVEDGANGFLVPVRDPRALAETMMRFIENPELIETMGQAGRRMAEKRFDVHSINRQIIKTLSKQKLLYFISEYQYFYTHRLPLALAAQYAGYDVAVVTNVEKDCEIIHRNGVRLLPFNIKRNILNPLNVLAVFCRLIMLYMKEKPDIVHHVSIKPALYGSLAARLTGVKYVVNAITGMGYIFTSKQMKARLLQPIICAGFRFLLNGKRTRLIVQNEDDGNFIIREHLVDMEKVRLIRSAGVDTTVFHPADEHDGPPIIVLASRMLWDKGIGEFVEAAKLLHERRVNARFVLVGDSDLQNSNSVSYLKLQEWSRSGDVEWWGKRDDMPEVFAQASIACLPSAYGEGVPKVLLEAAACGLPIVTTDTPGCRDVVHHGENGFLVPVRNIVELADALQRLIENPELCRRMGARGREIVVNEFTVERVVAETMSLYEELMQK